MVRQLLTESLVLSIAGGVLGLGRRRRDPARRAGAAARRACCRRAVTLAFDLRVVGFCAAAALAVGLLFGLAPAWQATSGLAGPA